jgi:hypothetical protein
LHIVNKDDVEAAGFFDDIQLMLISLKGWKGLIKNHKNWIAKIPSTLIIKQATNPN